MRIEKSIRENEQLRKSFNNLALAVFGFSFENWYEMGYWTDKYIPYSIVIDENVVANVSVNLIDIETPDGPLNLVQLGTIMTDVQYRNQGLIRLLIAEIEKDFDQHDGFYLFANDTVKEFYPKFGYAPAKEMTYRKQITTVEATDFVQVDMNNETEREVFVKAAEEALPAGAFSMVGNPQLLMFYLGQFMTDCVYYSQSENCYVIVEIEEQEVILHDVIAKAAIDLDALLPKLPGHKTMVQLGFTPRDVTIYEGAIKEEENTTLMVKGFNLPDGVSFPTLSQA